VALGTAPIPAAPYYDPAYFNMEREAVFRRTWLQIGHVCELPDVGSFIVRELEVWNASILIARGKDGVIRAFHNVCTHRGTQLVTENAGKASTFSCPYHRWTYGLQGQLLAAPDFESFFVEKADCSLKRVAVDSCGGMIFVHYNPQPEESLEAFLGPLATDMKGKPMESATTFSEYTYEIKGNWKAVYDNFQENYHIRFVHPKSIAPNFLSAENPFGYAAEFEFVGLHRKQLLTPNPDFNPFPVQAAAMGALVSEAISAGWSDLLASPPYFSLFPNILIFNAPTLPFSHTVYPLSVDRSRGVIRFYWNGDDSSATQRVAREYAMASARDIHAEDRPVIEAGQRGLNSGALRHIHFQAHEVLCRHFFNAVDAKVQAWKSTTAK
jgi:phenylpropionate dioxygenase-like ring-hydroxylating dioxygenase large terminal subunit